MNDERNPSTCHVAVVDMMQRCINNENNNCGAMASQPISVCNSTAHNIRINAIFHTKSQITK